MEREARVPAEPFNDLGMLVRGVVVEDHVHDLAGRHGRFDAVEEANELAVAMTLHALAEHRAVKNVEGGEQGCGAVTGIVVGLGGGMAGASRRSGRVRSSAWIWLFSSMDSTTAWGDGSM